LTNNLLLHCKEQVKEGQQKMESKTISLTFPLGVFSALKTTPEEFSKTIRLTAAVKWYEMGTVSQEKAAEIAGISREDFLLALSSFKVSPFQYSAEEVLREAGYA
jgi:predicted HTH domain antitoxin